MAVQIITVILFLLETQPHGVQWEAALYGHEYTGQKIELMRRRPHYTFRSFAGKDIGLQRVQEESSTFVLRYEGEQMLLDLTDMLQDYLQGRPLELPASVGSSAVLDAAFMIDEPQTGITYEEKTYTEPMQDRRDTTDLMDQGDNQSDNAMMTDDAPPRISISNIGNVVSISIDQLHIFLARTR